MPQFPDNGEFDGGIPAIPETGAFDDEMPDIGFMPQPPDISGFNGDMPELPDMGNFGGEPQFSYPGTGEMEASARETEASDRRTAVLSCASALVLLAGIVIAEKFKK